MYFNTFYLKTNKNGTVKKVYSSSKLPSTDFGEYFKYYLEKFVIVLIFCSMGKIVNHLYSIFIIYLCQNYRFRIFY